MAKGHYQLKHLISKHKPSVSVYAGSYDSYRDTVAIKVIDLDQLKDYQITLNEVSRTRRIRHANILPLLSCFTQASKIFCIYPFMYYGSCKDILDLINDLDLNSNEPDNTAVDRADEQRRLCFNEQSLQLISRSVLNALEYLHNRHIIHRCVCPENIYISENGHIYLSGLNNSISLIDQGYLVKRLHDFPSNIENYLNYMSPELLQQNLIGYNTKTDIYSFGVAICELANGVNPFIGCEKAQMLHEKLVGFDIGLWDRSILKQESKNLFVSVCATENPRLIASVERRFFTDRFRNFVDLCVQRSSELRPSASDLLQHVYLKKAKLNNVVQTLQMSVISEGLINIINKLMKSKTGNSIIELETSNIIDTNNNSNKIDTSAVSVEPWEY